MNAQTRKYRLFDTVKGNTAGYWARHRPWAVLRKKHLFSPRVVALATKYAQA